MDIIDQKLQLKPTPNQISNEAIKIWASRICPDWTECQEILVELALLFGVDEDLTGFEEAILAFLPTLIPFLLDSITTEQIEAIKNALRQYIEQNHLSTKTSHNLLIRFHLKNKDTTSYLDLAPLLHQGLVGRFEQIHERPNQWRLIYNAVTGISAIMEHLELDDLSDPQNPQRVFDDVVYRLTAENKKRKNANSKGKSLSADSIGAYARHFRTILFDQSRGRDFVPLGSFTKQKQTKEPPIKKETKKTIITEKPDDSFTPDELQIRHESRREFGDANFEAFIEELAETDPERARRIKDKQPDTRGNTLSKLDPILTPSSPDVLSRHTLAQIERLLKQDRLNPDPLNRLAITITYHIQLFLRRNIQFSCGLRLGTRDQVLDGPVVDLDDCVIYHIPKIYFGHPKTVVDEFGVKPFLDSANGEDRWAEHFQGYTHSAPVGAVPLPQQLLDEILAYRQMLAELAQDDSIQDKLLLWRNRNGSLVPFTPTHFKEALKKLNTLLQTTKTNHRPINATQIMNSFDAYILGRGLPYPDYWHLTERARYVFEMPTRYTLRPLRAIAAIFFKLHNQFLREIQAASDLPLDLTLTDPDQAAGLPDLLLGSWHALEEAVICELARFFRSPAAGEIYPTSLGSTQDFKSLTPKQKQHNAIIWETIFWVGELHGTRDFEIHRLSKNDVNLSTQSMIVDGRGRRKRELPLHPLLSARLEQLLQKRDGKQFEALFWLYANKYTTKPLTNATMTKQYFAETTEQLGWGALHFGALRHRFRSELALQNIPDETINYLMGHGKSFVGEFSRKSLDRDARAVYLQAASRIIDKYH